MLLTVNDSYGDGMVAIRKRQLQLHRQWEVVASEGTFTTSDVTSFCAEPTDIPGCTDATACNYNASATVDDGSCAVLDACGVAADRGGLRMRLFGHPRRRLRLQWQPARRMR